MGILFALGALFFLIILVVAVVFYVFMAFGLFKMAQNLGIENPWMAFIPVANLYIMGKLAGTVSFQNYQIPSIELVLPIGSVVASSMARVSLIGPIISLAFLVLYFMTLYNIYKKYRGDNATVMIVLSIFLPFMPAIYLFGMRDEKAMM